MNIADWTLLISAMYFLVAIIVSLRICPPIYMARCGHNTQKRGAIRVEGWPISVKLPFRGGRLDMCLECFEQKSIVCGECARPIIPGDFIRIIPLSGIPESVFPGSAIACRKKAGNEQVIVPFQTGSVRELKGYRTGDMAVVGCMRSDCSRQLLPDAFLECIPRSARLKLWRALLRRMPEAIDAIVYYASLDTRIFR